MNTMFGFWPDRKDVVSAALLAIADATHKTTQAIHIETRMATSSDRHFPDNLVRLRRRAVFGSAAGLPSAMIQRLYPK
jgi:hypothetical protein